MAPWPGGFLHVGDPWTASLSTVGVPAGTPFEWCATGPYSTSSESCSGSYTAGQVGFGVFGTGSVGIWSERMYASTTGLYSNSVDFTVTSTVSDTCSVFANPMSVSPGGSSVITWTSSPTSTSCFLMFPDKTGSASGTGSFIENDLTSSSTFNATCAMPGVPNFPCSSATVTVRPSSRPPGYSWNVSAPYSACVAPGNQTGTVTCVDGSGNSAPSPADCSGPAPSGDQACGSYNCYAEACSFTPYSGGAYSTESSCQDACHPGTPLSCSVAPSTAVSGEEVVFKASGGDDSAYSFSAPGSTNVNPSVSASTAMDSYATANSLPYSVTVNDSDGDTSGQCSVTVVSVPPSKSDLIVSDFRLTDASGHPKSSFAIGDSIYWSATVQNIGTLSTGSNTSVDVYPNSIGNTPQGSPDMGSVQIRPLAPGATSTVSNLSSAGYSPVGAGSRIAMAIVDPSESIPESSYDNNGATASYSVNDVFPLLASLQVSTSSVSVAAFDDTHWDHHPSGTNCGGLYLRVLAELHVYEF